MQRIAAIDAGSNALRMMVGNLTSAGQVEPIRSMRLPVRLGQDVFSRGKLQEKTIRQAAEAFDHFRRVADELGAENVRAIATSAMREAVNRDILLDRIFHTTGIQVEVISAAEEARLIHLAVDAVLDLRKKRLLLIDIGGGSVEVTLSEDRNIVSAESYKLGAVRLLQELDAGRERAAPWFASDLPLSALVRAYAEPARRQIRRQIGNGHVNLCAVTGGTAEDLGRLSQKLFKKANDQAVSPAELERLIEVLERMDVKRRMRKLDLRPDRADVILPAAVILHLIAREARVRRVAIPHVGLKDGVLLEMAGTLRKGRQPPRRGQIIASAQQLGHKYQVDAKHAALTARLAMQLFDQSQELHHLGVEERLLLEAGALLHDLGHFIEPGAHDRHGYYILKSTPLIGLSDEQGDIVAHLARYHRRIDSPANDASFNCLPQVERTTVLKLTALLRLADAMDASHLGRARSVKLVEKKRNWQLTLSGRGDLTVERRELERRRSLFEEAFGVVLEIRDRN